MCSFVAQNSNAQGNWFGNTRPPASGVLLRLAQGASGTFWPAHSRAWEKTEDSGNEQDTGWSPLMTPTEYLSEMSQELSPPLPQDQVLLEGWCYKRDPQHPYRRQAATSNLKSPLSWARPPAEDFQPHHFILPRKPLQTEGQQPSALVVQGPVSLLRVFPD